MHGLATLLPALLATGNSPLDGGPPSEPQFEPPVRLVADGAPIDVTGGAGHAAPLYADLLGDPLPDLVVGDLAGRLHVFENVGEPGAPRLVGRGPLAAEGQPIAVHNW